MGLIKKLLVMRIMLFFIIFAFTLMFIGIKCEQSKDPYEEGAHWDYSIECENGFVYKSLDSRRGTIQVLNSDGTPLKCGEKIY
jgi:hypothetical protein